MNADTSTNPDVKRVEECLRHLGEHFDTVQIFTTRHEEGDTKSVQKGVGNWYARYGQVRQWVVAMDEAERVQSRKDTSA